MLDAISAQGVLNLRRECSLHLASLFPVHSLGHFPAALSFLSFWFCFSSPPGTWKVLRVGTPTVKTYPPISAHTDRLHHTTAHLTLVQGGERLFKHMQFQLVTLAVAQPPSINLQYAF